MIAVFADEDPQATLVRWVLTANVDVVISTITLAEATTRPAIQGDWRQIQVIQTQLATVPRFTIETVDRLHAIETALVRAQTRLKLPDAVVVATARLSGAVALIGNDRQWRHKPLGVPYHHLDNLLALP
ncbi:MAG: hypothetical protein AVDCRST_MAG73-2784 [uncultured Thermomicrobiales bacterium]|uniref:PIN domain-containing protein n=1 Tax=uncultured Thermomicrobiales bacterium TaxID=1645740 RepID=A0A6J4UGG2_9BACT|nr:MAG: hypothetical protein AVDCRST_MAG73-2784 [uncultured Thermomicrobiales bacterium]